MTEARSIERVREAARARAQAEQLDTQRQWLDHLNNMLRHEVLNGATVIRGNVSMLLEDGDLGETERGRLEAVRRRTDDMTAVIEDVRALLQATNGSAVLDRTDLAAVVREEARALEDRHPHVVTDLSLPEELPVWADDLLPRLFTNLLSNAVGHNPSDRPRVTVRGEATEGVARVTVSDNGSGVPEAALEGLFDRDHDRDSPAHGMGLYLVRRLAQRYDGAIELAANGATFAVELPLADRDDPSSTADAGAATGDEGRADPPTDSRTESGRATD